MNNIDVNQQYEYTGQMLGIYSTGGTIEIGTYAPHPENISYKNNNTGDTVTDLSAIVIGGINGLNN